MRTKKIKIRSTRACRFGFPRSVTNIFIMRDVAVSGTGRRQLKSKVDCIIFQDHKMKYLLIIITLQYLLLERAIWIFSLLEKHLHCYLGIASNMYRKKRKAM